MSPPYDRRGSSRRQHGVWNHWVPLAVTVTVATIGVVAWIWSQRSSGEDDDEDETITQHLDYDNAIYDSRPAYRPLDDGNSTRAPPSFRSDLRPDEVGYGVTEAAEATGSSWGARMSGALRRTPSPQHILDRAGKTVAAGVVAAGTAVGSALASIREDDKSAFADHETWSEEADAKQDTVPSPLARDGPSRKKRVVVLVVSADTKLDDLDEDGYHEHASILSHIPKHNDHSKIKLFVLIYAPTLKDSVAEASSNRPPASISSSFSMVGQEQVLTPGDEMRSPQLPESNKSAFNTIYAQAVELVDKEVNVLPFTTPAGYVHILHHLKPEVVYLQESLAGDNGSNVQKLQTWLRYDVLLVVGADNGHGGLADSESEAERSRPEQLWWQREDRVGRGRGVVVVDGMRVSDDWSRRIQGNE
ncbi:hypothetical protein BD289DRAFT_479452 [Coniella lustricola]|uniref:Peroxin 22-like protein n=1 Tax=Coniella lustricola TaxID=2025994 RepID=A0A2T3AJ26_9PEZI|nr:hypothetical protein BD289DRAFT_479452 [Coniella lustricola]